MSTRSIENEDERQSLHKFIDSRKLPFTVNIETGKLRSTKQNRLQRTWINEIAAQMPESSAEEWRGYCKLRFGVPIMRAENEKFCEVYDRLVRPLDYEDKIELMMLPMDMPVTRIMSTKQKKAYLDAIFHHFTALGVQLTDPEMMGLEAMRQEAA